MATALMNYTDATNLASPLPAEQGQSVADELGQVGGMQVYPRSICAVQHSLLFLGRRGENKCLGVISAGPASRSGFSGHSRSVTVAGTQATLTHCDTTNGNATALRIVLPFLVAKPLGLRKSAGCGDRLGLATPGHVRAI